MRYRVIKVWVQAMGMDETAQEEQESWESFQEQ